jgi:hypothetical protein
MLHVQQQPHLQWYRLLIVAIGHWEKYFFYWKVVDVGDAYLGRCLYGLDPNLSLFCVLPLTGQ